jgi:polysaccharide biosynthesis protein PslE
MPFRHAHPLTLRDFTQIFFRHKKKILAWSFSVVGLSLVAILILPRKYTSEAKLFVRLGRESVTLDPTATTGQIVQVQETRDNQINSTRDMLTSRALLERVVEKIGAKTILHGPQQQAQGATPARSLVGDLMSAVGLATFSSPVSPEEKAVAKLSKSLAVKVGRNTSVIDFSCEAGNALLAQQILQAFLDAFHEQHLAANRTAGSLEFFTAQAARLKTQLDAAVASLRDAKNESGIVSLPAQQKALQDQLIQLETASLAAEASLASSEASIVVLRKSLAEVPQQLPTQQTAGFPNVAADSLQQEYFKLRLVLHDLESRLGDDHRKVIDARTQVRQSEAMLNAIAPERTQSTVGLHPSRQALDLDLRREETLAASLSAKSGALKDQIAVLQRRSRDLNEHEVRIADLERQVIIAETSYRSYMDHLEQVRIGDALEVDRISNVNVVQPPSLVQTPVSPKSTLILGAGLLVAVFGAFGLALGSEYLDNSLRTPDDLESQLGLPVLSSIPRSSRHDVFAEN